MNTLTQVVGETWGLARITFIAALINISLNLYFIPRFGIMAAAINTAIAYLFLFAFMLVRANKKLNIDYELGRIGKLFFMFLAIVAVGSFIDFHVFTNLLIKAFLLICFPVGLFAVGFYTDSEKMVICNHLQNALRK